MFLIEITQMCGHFKVFKLLCSYGQTECSAAGTITLPFDTVGGHVGGPAVWSQVNFSFFAR